MVFSSFYGPYPSWSRRHLRDRLCNKRMPQIAYQGTLPGTPHVESCAGSYLGCELQAGLHGMSCEPPPSVLLGDVLEAITLDDLPLHVIGDLDDPEFGAIATCPIIESLDHLNE